MEDGQMDAETAHSLMQKMREQNLGAVWFAGRWWFKADLREIVA